MGRSGWLGAAVGVLWLAVFLRWHTAWSAVPEQAYGWLVPVLALGLAWDRMKERPDGPVAHGRRSFSAARLLAWLGTIGALLALPFALTVLEANPLWPLAQWTAVALAIAATLTAVGLAGGSAWARHLAFPVLFVATALAWPTWITVRLVGALVSFNAQLAAAATSALGHPALVHGNVIELASGYVGVDEACSGMRSLQTVWMAGWFFGELFRLRWLQRLTLVIASLAVAVATNWMRTMALTWLAAAHGIAASERWHDRAGGAELGLTLAAVALLAWRAARARRVVDSAAAVRPGEAETSVPASPGRVLLVGAVLAAAGPTVWYRWHEHAAAERIQWTLRKPDAAWNVVDVPKRAHDLLQATSLHGLAHAEPGGGEALVFLVTWEDDVARAASAEAHDPTICLPAAGLQPTVAPGPQRVEIGGVPVEFAEASFTAGGREQRVFYCHWDAWLRRARPPVPTDMTDVPAWRLARVREGRRRGDAAYLALVTPVAGERAAREWLRVWAPRLFERR